MQYKSRALRRKNNVKKAIRKRNIARQIHHTEWYDNLHAYSKNKVHCSCNMCRFRPNYDPDQKTASDIRHENACDQKLKEYEYAA